MSSRNLVRAGSTDLEVLSRISGIPVKVLRGRDWLCRAVSHATESLDQSPTLSEVAEIANYERTHFSRKFRAAVGCTYSRWLTNLRAEQAARLLYRSERSVLEVALAVGYSAARSLERACRQRFGRSPSELRQARLVAGLPSRPSG
jgi:transcriptional regulator GlxA family with amidase domain